MTIDDLIPKKKVIEIVAQVIEALPTAQADRLGIKPA